MRRTYVGREMTHAGFEEIVLDGPLHQVVADGRLGDFLVVLDGFVVVALHGSEVGDFKVEFVRQSAQRARCQRGHKRRELILSAPHRSPYPFCTVMGVPGRVRERETYASALSFSNHPAAVSYASTARF